MERLLARITGVLALSLVLAAPAAAHELTLKAVSPPDGSTVTTPLRAVTVHYSGPAAIRNATIQAPDGSKRAARVASAGATSRIALRIGQSGRYTLRWRVPQADGHFVGYTTTFIAAQSAVVAPPPAASEQDRSGALQRVVAWLAGLLRAIFG